MVPNIAERHFPGLDMSGIYCRYPHHHHTASSLGLAEAMPIRGISGMSQHRGSGPAPSRTVRILGTHGVPADYGGFETAAENVGLYLANAGWRVIVYCQVTGHGPIIEDTWRGLERVKIPVDADGWRGTSIFDLRAVAHAVRFDDPCLLFGYNTAVFNLIQRLKGTPLVINMDGMEWSRSRWGRFRQSILWANEQIGRVIGNDLIADHPRIEDYLRRRTRAAKITMIPYGADAVTSAPEAPVREQGLEPGKYLTLICRPIPENSILELVQGFSARQRGVRLAILGDYDGERIAYHHQVREAASDEVEFLGSIYDPPTTQALRYHALGYLHGHTVGGTNPSLVEAMGAGNPVIAHDNVYNRWVAEDSALYFSTADDVDRHITELLESPNLIQKLGERAQRRHGDLFTWQRVGAQYDRLLSRHLPEDPNTSATVHNSAPIGGLA